MQNKKNTLWIPIFEKEEGVRAFFSTKQGAVEKSPYDNKEVFRQNKAENAVWVWVKQIHGNCVYQITEEKISSIKPGQDFFAGEGDGLVTDRKNLLLTTVHADCLALYFYDPVRSCIGLAHAGWRGTYGEIGKKILITMTEQYGCKKEDIRCQISPGISACCFETGKEVYELFFEKWPALIEKTNRIGEKAYLDLKEINRMQCVEFGIDKIEICTECTCCGHEDFCSYRYEKGKTQRMGAGIILI